MLLLLKSFIFFIVNLLSAPPTCFLSLSPFILFLSVHPERQIYERESRLIACLNPEERNSSPFVEYKRDGVR